ncbi:MAG: hypothetical protein OWU84_06560 [Firmicutes bacterium]|nr:hypothetical protein [Bacillota bacterium]
MNTSLGDLLPLLLLGQRRDLLPLLILLLGDQNASFETGGDPTDEASIPANFNAYLSSLVGDYVRVSLDDDVDNAATLAGILVQVGSDYIALRDVIASSVTLGFRDRVIIPISNIAGIDRVPYFQRILPLLGLLTPSISS